MAAIPARNPNELASQTFDLVLDGRRVDQNESRALLFGSGNPALSKGYTPDELKGKYMVFLVVDELKDAVQRFQFTIDVKDLSDDKKACRNPLEQHPHITIASAMPKTPEFIRQMQSTFSTRGQIQLEFEKLGCFQVRNKKFDDGSVHSYDVLFVEPTQNMNLDSAHYWTHLLAKTEDKHGVYKPHITVAYLKPGTAYKYTAQRLAMPLEVTATHVELKLWRDDVTPAIFIPLRKPRAAEPAPQRPVKFNR